MSGAGHLGNDRMGAGGATGLRHGLAGCGGAAGYTRGGCVPIACLLGHLEGDFSDDIWSV